MAYRAKMSQADRAKQFMPFAALRGYPEALRKREQIVVDKVELSEERQRELDILLRQLQKGDMVTVVYFCRQQYLKLTGMITRIDETARILQLVQTKIPLDHIYDIRSESIDRMTE